MKRLISAIAALALVFSVTIAPQGASAVNVYGCQPSLGSAHLGHQRIATGAAVMTGVKANIRANVEDFNVCTGTTEPRANSLWIALSDNVSPYNIVQFGLVRCGYDPTPGSTWPNRCPASSISAGWFWAFGDTATGAGPTAIACGYPSGFDCGSSSSGALKAVELVATLQSDGSGYNIQIRVGGVAMVTQPVSWTPRKASWMGENWNVKDAVGGESPSLDRGYLNQAAYKTGTGAYVWANFSGSTVVRNGTLPDPPYKLNLTSNSMFIWTEDY